RSSHSWAAGRTTVSAKSWTHFWIWSWSSLRVSENSDIAAASGRRQTSYRSVTRLRAGCRRDKRRLGKFPYRQQCKRQGQQHGARDVRRGDAHVLEQGPGGQRSDHPGEAAGRLLEAEHRAAPFLASVAGNRGGERRRQHALPEHEQREPREQR